MRSADFLLRLARGARFDVPITCSPFPVHKQEPGYCRGQTMLSRCVNPSCCNQFRYLHQGTIFVFHCDSDEAIVTRRLNFAGLVDNLLYAWLCDSCSQTFEVALDLQDRIKVRYRDYAPWLASVEASEQTIMEKVDRVLRQTIEYHPNWNFGGESSTSVRAENMNTHLQ